MCLCRIKKDGKFFGVVFIRDYELFYVRIENKFFKRVVRCLFFFQIYFKLFLINVDISVLNYFFGLLNLGDMMFKNILVMFSKW